MAKNILIFADGTGNEGGLLPDESRSNVYKLFRATRTGPESHIDPSKQLAFYISGIGTPTPLAHSSRWRRAGEAVAQAFGCGMTQKIVDCYVAIISVWQPGDRIYLFGFSRGAYAVRCLAHILELLGVPTTETNGDPLNFNPRRLQKLALVAVEILYKSSIPQRKGTKRDREVAAFCASHCCSTGDASVPYFVGVWDTVASMGWTRLFPVKYDSHFPMAIRFARHAMAIDEYRKDFLRLPWCPGTFPKADDGEPVRFEEVWFAGNHAHIGGSYPENESRLSDITLKWMADFIELELPEKARVTVNATF
jgi:uncharacterized protein (DUF2235 family)